MNSKDIYNQQMAALKEEQDRLDKLRKQEEKKARLGVKYVHYDDTANPLNTIDNLKCILNKYQILIQYNEMSMMEEIVIPNKQYHNDIKRNQAFADLQSYCNQHGLKIKDYLQGYITKIAGEHAYHPVKEWLNPIVWDGVDRMQQFYNTIVVKNESDADTLQLKQTLMRKWALSAVAALYHENFNSEGALVFVGKQGIGKTSWMFKLLPTELKHCLKDSCVLNVDNKDSVRSALMYWIVELGELGATFKTSDIEALKAFITATKTDMRNPYARLFDQYQRKTIFFGSVNNVEFLVDDENRRYWTLNVERTVDTQLDVAQFWAQMKVMYQKVADICSDINLRIKHNEYGWYLSPTERKQLQQVQAYNKSVDPIIDQLRVRVVPSKDVRVSDWSNTQYLTCTQILQQVGILTPNKADTNRTAIWLRENGYDKNGDKKYKVLIVSDVEQYLAKKKIDNKTTKINEVLEYIRP
jgi:putative DNA primase/helicase